MLYLYLFYLLKMSCCCCSNAGTFLDFFVSVIVLGEFGVGVWLFCFFSLLFDDLFGFNSWYIPNRH